MEIDVKAYRKKKTKLAVNRSINIESILPNKVSDKNKGVLYRELRVLLKSGVTLEEALVILISQYKNKTLVSGLSLVKEELLKGKTLVNSMGRVKFFTPFEINSLSIGEQTKTLVKVLEELELFFEKRHKLKSQIKTVLTYPAFVILITIGVLVFMLRSVVPMFEKVFRQFNSELPSLTKKIIYISNNFSYFLLMSTVFIGIGLLLYFKFKNTSNFRRVAAKLVLAIPFVGTLVRSIYLSRFCNALGLLLGANVSIIDSLSYVKDMISYYPIESTINKIKIDITKGKSFADSLGNHSFYGDRLVSMVRVSEEVNELEQMFDYLSSIYSEEVEVMSKRIGVLIEPLIIILIGSLVGVILIAMYLPMFDLSKILNSN